MIGHFRCRIMRGSALEAVTILFGRRFPSCGGVTRLSLEASVTPTYGTFSLCMVIQLQRSFFRARYLLGVPLGTERPRYDGDL
jgi:hypothetical protein